VRALLPRRGIVLGALAVLFAATVLLFSTVPTAFIPDEDQGYFITSFQLPEGASIDRTDVVAKRSRRSCWTRRASSGSTCSAASTRSRAPPRPTSARCS
jgi:multidrug efflux pump subunit AcrB